MDFTNLENLPKPVLFEILLQLDIRTMLNYIKTCTLRKDRTGVCKIFDDRRFWKQRLQNDFGIDASKVKNVNDYAKYYYRLLFNKQFLTEQMIEAVKQGNKNRVKTFVNLGANNLDWGLDESVLKGDLKLVKYFISKGANNWGSALYWFNKANYDNIDLEILFETLYKLQETYSDNDLIDFMKSKNLSTEGTREDMIKRYALNYKF